MLALGVHRQTAAVRMFLSFFRLGILAFEIGERHVQRVMTERTPIVLTQDQSTFSNLSLNATIAFSVRGGVGRMSAVWAHFDTFPVLPFLMKSNDPFNPQEDFSTA